MTSQQHVLSYNPKCTPCCRHIAITVPKHPLLNGSLGMVMHSGTHHARHFGTALGGSHSQIHSTKECL